MERKIIRVGNSYGIIIPKHILKLLGWDVRSLEAQIDLDRAEMIVKKRQR